MATQGNTPELGAKDAPVVDPSLLSNLLAAAMEDQSATEDVQTKGVTSANLDQAVTAVDFDAIVTPKEPGKTPLPPAQEPVTQDMLSALIAAAATDEEGPRSEPEQSPPPAASDPVLEPATNVEAAANVEAATAETPQPPRVLFLKWRPKATFGTILLFSIPVAVVASATLGYYFGKDFLGARDNADSGPPVAVAYVAAPAPSIEEAATEPQQSVTPENNTPLNPLSMGELPASVQESAPSAAPSVAPPEASSAAPSEHAQEAMDENPELGALRAAMEKLTDKAPSTETDAVLDGLNAYLETELAPHKGQALLLKAKYYLRKGLSITAYDLYRQFLMSYPDETGRDQVFFDAAVLAKDLNRPQESANILERMLEQYPGSPLAPRAELMLGNAYGSMGRESDGTALFERILQFAPDSAEGRRALAHMGKIALDQGRTDEALKLLESRPSVDPAQEGNDVLRLNLARAYRAAGRANEARQTLSEVIQFFPRSEILPQAYCELPPLLEEMGLRPEALQAAQQAVERFPGNPLCLANLGKALAANGNKKDAAQRFHAAELAGAKDPEMLLTAARYFADSDDYEGALDAYERLLDRYQGTPQACEASIEMAGALYHTGKKKEAVRRLDDLAELTPAGPQRLPILVALGAMYREAALPERAAEVFTQVAALSTEPELTAQCALALLDAGETKEVRALMSRLDIAKVSPKRARELMEKSGEALLAEDPPGALKALEKAREGAADEAAPAADITLMKACIAADNAPGMDKLFAELEERVKQKPAESGRLADVLTMRGEWLFDKGQFEQAAASYERAAQLGDPKTEQTAWAKFQQANALLRAAKTTDALPILDAVAASTVTWAPQAKLQAQNIRLRQRLEK